MNDHTGAQWRYTSISMSQYQFKVFVTSVLRVRMQIHRRDSRPGINSFTSISILYGQRATHARPSCQRGSCETHCLLSPTSYALLCLLVFQLRFSLLSLHRLLSRSRLLFSFSCLTGLPCICLGVRPPVLLVNVFVIFRRTPA